MKKKFHFISGLPRSGSTLLSVILNQNPKFKASISGPLASFARSIIKDACVGVGYSSECPVEKRKKIIQGIFDNYHDDPKKEVFFDTSRGWTLHTSLIKELYPNAKIIACVRDFCWILDSFELLVRDNAFSESRLFPKNAEVSVYSRTSFLMSEQSPLGFAILALKQALFSQEKDMLFIMEYDDLVKKPEETMRRIYEFIGEDYFKHDFDNVEYCYEQYDEEMDLRGMHKTRKKVDYLERKTVLPPDIVQRYAGLEIWRKKF